MTGTRDRKGVSVRNCKDDREEAVAAAVVPITVEACVDGGDLRQLVTITVEDWAEMQDLSCSMGRGAFPDLVVGLALRRCTGIDPLPTIRFVGGDGTDLPNRPNQYPGTTW